VRLQKPALILEPSLLQPRRQSGDCLPTNEKVCILSTTNEEQRLVKRAKRLQNVIDDASERHKGDEHPLVVGIGDFRQEFMKKKGYGSLRLSLNIHYYPSVRVGANMGDKYFELKLIPEFKELALVVEPKLNGHDVFLLVPSIVLVTYYSAKEIKEISALIRDAS
jgi:hypothetical protein